MTEHSVRTEWVFRRSEGLASPLTGFISDGSEETLAQSSHRQRTDQWQVKEVFVCDRLRPRFDFVFIMKVMPRLPASFV